jgi:hypothetical protein
MIVVPRPSIHSPQTDQLCEPSTYDFLYVFFVCVSLFAFVLAFSQLCERPPAHTKIRPVLSAPIKTPVEYMDTKDEEHTNVRS